MVNRLYSVMSNVLPVTGRIRRLAVVRCVCWCRLVLGGLFSDEDYDADEGLGGVTQRCGGDGERLSLSGG